MPSPCYQCEHIDQDKNLPPCDTCEKTLDYAITEGMLPPEEKTVVLESEKYHKVSIKGKICIVYGCDNPVFAKDLCENCYGRKRTVERKGLVFDFKLPGKQKKQICFHVKFTANKESKQVMATLKKIANENSISLSEQVMVFIKRGIEG